MTTHDDNSPALGDRPTSAPARPALHVPSKRSSLATAWHLAGTAAAKLPRSRTQLRKRRRRFIDKRILGDPRASRGLVAGWQLIGRATRPSTAAQTSYVNLSGRLAARTVRAGQQELAATVLDVAEGSVASALIGNPLAVRAAMSRMNAGQLDVDVTRLVADALTNADRALASADLGGAASHLQDAFNVAFHRVLHFEDRPSALAADPATFLAPFRDSTAFSAMTSVIPRQPSQPPKDRPHRLLFVTGSNFNFANSLIDDLSGRPDLEVRAVNLTTQEGGPTRLSYVNVVKDRLTQATGGEVRMPHAVAEELQWADTIFIEWGHRALTWISSLTNVSARVVVRLHSYEAMTQFPLTTNWGGVHDVIFVSEHIRQLVQTSSPQLLDAAGPRVHTIPNKNDFAPYVRPKKPGSEFTLGLVGWGQVVKDPLWALEVLELLRAEDPRYGMRFLGSDFAPTAKLTRAAIVYRDAVRAKLAELGDAVHLAGYSTDMPESLRRVGVILSTSHREGTHEGFLEGVASGAFPVARNWPFVARWGGAKSMVPDEWVVTTPREAADRILAAQADGTLVDQGFSGAAWVREHYDWSVVGPRLEGVILGTDAVEQDPTRSTVPTTADGAP